MALDLKEKGNFQKQLNDIKTIVNALQKALDGGGTENPITWDTIPEKPAVVASGADVAAARASIGAGTGNSNVAIGTTATTAAAGNHNHAITVDAPSGLAAYSTLQLAFVGISARIKALEDAAV